MTPAEGSERPTSVVVIIVVAPTVGFFPDGDLDALVGELLRQRRALADAGELLGRVDSERGAVAGGENGRFASVDTRCTGASIVTRCRRDVDE